MSDLNMEAFLDERLHDIDEFIQSELGFAPLSVTEPFNGEEVHSLSSTLGAPDALLLEHLQGKDKLMNFCGICSEGC